MGIQDRTPRGNQCFESILTCMAFVPCKCDKSQKFLLKIKMYWSRSVPYSLKIISIKFIYYCATSGSRDLKKS